jgi:hypothetical protein
LAERLIASLDEDAEVELEWRLEAERRDAAIEGGEERGVPLEVALESARAILR